MPPKFITKDGGRICSFRDDIATILTALHTDSEYSKDVTLDELLCANEYNLSLERYIQKVPTFQNGVSFESIIKSITRKSLARPASWTRWRLTK